MDYIQEVAVERMKKVIGGEAGGISKFVNWQGGGSFTYLELKKYNQVFIEQIEEAKDLPDRQAGTQALLEIWEQMKAKSFLNYNVDIKKQEEHIEDFKALRLKEQKQHLCELLDKNQLYVNLSSLNDKDFECTDEEKSLNHDFYKIKR
jgi:adenine-specific DNA-methyltransferase